jgi:hypothetical protein
MMVTHTSKNGVENAINLHVVFTFPMIGLLCVVTKEKENRFFPDDALTPIP